MKFKRIIRNILVEQTEGESKLQNFYKKLVVPKEGKKKGLIDFDTFRQIIFADPTTKKPENFDTENSTYEDMVDSRVQPGKYTNWLLKNFIKPNAEELDNIGTSDVNDPNYKETVKEYKRLYLEDLFGVTSMLANFNKIKQYIDQDKRDINLLTPNSLKSIIETLPEEIKNKINTKDVKSQARQERKTNRFAHPGAEIMMVGKDYTLIKIDGTDTPQKEAAQWYGGFYDYMNGESHWCTSPPGSNYFMTYASAGPLYVIMANDDKGLVGDRTGLPQERYQISIPKNQYMDRMDRRFDVVQMFNGPFAEFKEILKDEFSKSFVSPNTNQVNINLGSSNEGVYISLYGLDDILTSLPDTITELNITNTSASVDLKITDDITRFKNLDTLLLQNVVSSIPDSIGQITSLTILSLPDNKNLTKIPDSIGNLDLDFLVLTNSNVKLSDKLLEDYELLADEVYSKM